MATPKHNLKALVVGTGEFSFSEGAASAAETLLKGWLDFGNIVAFTPAMEASTEEHMGSYRGIRRKDKTISTENALQYTIKADEWNAALLKILFGATAGAGLAQSAITATAGSAWLFTSPSPSGTQKWYDVKDASGVRIRKLTALTIATLTEGTDFEVDYLLGRVRFLVTQTATRTPTITCSAITAGSVDSYIPLTPFGDVIKQGFGRLVCYDQNDNNVIVYSHEDFSCEVTLDSSSEMGGTGIGELALKVVVTDTVGLVYVRQENDN